MRIVFAGTPDFSAFVLQQLLQSEHDIVAVYTQPDRRSGRGKKLKPTPVKQVALDAELPVYQPLSLKPESEQSTLADFNADLMIVVAYGLILPQAVLDIPKFGCFNIHASLLPRWRGAAPIERAIEAGDHETGITIMQMDAGLDTGDMLTKLSCDIDASTTGDSLRSSMQELGSKALMQALQQLEAGSLKPEPQNNELANYAHKLDKAEAAIDWNEPAIAIERRIRAFHSSNVCYTELPNGERLKIWSAEVQDLSALHPPGTIVEASKNRLLIACGSQALALESVQLPGGKAMPVGAALNGRGNSFPVGEQLKFQTGSHA